MPEIPPLMNPLNWLKNLTAGWKNLKRWHKWLTGFTAAWIVVVVAAHTPLFYLFGPDWMNKTFAESFWPSFISDFGVGLLLVWVVEAVLKRATQADEQADYALKMDFRVTADVAHRKTLQFYVINNGKQSFPDREITWNIYVEQRAVRHTTPEMEFRRVELFPTIYYRHFSDVLNRPLHPENSGDLLEIMLFWTGGERTTTIYGYLSTEQGVFPRTVRLDADSQLLPESLATFEVELPKDFTSPS